MKILRFKTTIFDKSQIEEIEPFLNAEKTISRWKVDPEVSGNILSVSGEDLDPASIEKLIQECGYEAEMLEVIAIGGNDL